jgi:hypothetical protein
MSQSSFPTLITSSFIPALWRLPPGESINPADFLKFPVGQGLETLPDLRLTSNKIHLGKNAGLTNQDVNSVAIGEEAGQTNQSYDSYAFGYKAGNLNQRENSVAFGALSGEDNQKNNCVAIGAVAGQTRQGVTDGVETGGSIAIGYGAGQTDQKTNAVAIGNGAGASAQGAYSIAIGLNSVGTGDNSIAIGKGASTSTYNNSVAIGTGATSGAANQITLGTATESVRVLGTTTLTGATTATGLITANGGLTMGGSNNITLGTGAVVPDTNGTQLGSVIVGIFNTPGSSFNTNKNIATLTIPQTGTYIVFFSFQTNYTTLPTQSYITVSSGTSVYTPTPGLYAPTVINSVAGQVSGSFPIVVTTVGTVILQYFISGTINFISVQSYSAMRIA